MRCARLSPLALLILLLSACAPGAPPPADEPAQAVAPPPPASPAGAAAPATATPRPSRVVEQAGIAASTATPGAAASPSPEPPRMPLSAIGSWGMGVPVGAAYRPDGAAFAVVTARRLELRDAGQPERLLWGIDLPLAAHALAFAPDGATIALGVGAPVELRPAADGTLRATLPAEGEVRDLAFAADAPTLAAATPAQVLLWEQPAAAPARRLALGEAAAELGPAGELTSVAIGADGQLVVGGDSNGNVVVWRAADGAVAQVFSVGLRVVADVALAPDGLTVAAASEGWRSEAGAAWVWDIAGGAEPRILTIDDSERFLAPVERVAFAPDGAELALGAADGTLARWSIPAGELLEVTAAHRAAVVALGYAPDGGRLLSAGRDGAIGLRDRAGGAERRAALAPAISAVALAPDGGLAAAGGEDGTITLIRPDGAAAKSFVAHEGSINALAVAPTGELLVSAGDDGLARLWALPGGQARGELAGHAGPVLSAAMSPDGGRVVTAGWDGTLRVWRLGTGELERAIVVLESDGLSATAILDIAISADGETVAATSYGGQVQRYRLADGEPAGALSVEGGGWVLRVAYAPAGGLLAALDQSGQVNVWGADGEPLGSAAVPGATDLGWVGERVLATAGGAHGTQLWALSDGPLVALAAAPTGADSIAVAPGEGRICLGSRAGTVELRALR